MDKLLPTELIGSYALPGWLWAFSERLEQRMDLGETEPISLALGPPSEF